MSELDEAWAAALAQAETRARLAGHVDIAAYLSLRTSNDLLRTTGIEWLVSTFETLAGEANRHGASLQVSRDDKHRFQVGNNTMVGRLLTLTAGVRKLFVETGWPRTPGDGIVRGAGLARAHIRHLGLKAASDELLLVLSSKGTPKWIVSEGKRNQQEFHEAAIRHHLNTLLDAGNRFSRR